MGLLRGAVFSTMVGCPKNPISLNGAFPLLHGPFCDLDGPFPCGPFSSGKSTGKQLMKKRHIERILKRPTGRGLAFLKPFAGSCLDSWASRSRPLLQH